MKFVQKIALENILQKLSNRFSFLLNDRIKKIQILEFVYLFQKKFKQKTKPLKKYKFLRNVYCKNFMSTKLLRRVNDLLLKIFLN